MSRGSHSFSDSSFRSIPAAGVFFGSMYAVSWCSATIYSIWHCWSPYLRWVIFRRIPPWCVV
jgi:hypothetical protein